MSHGETDLSDHECVDLELIRDTGRILRATVEGVDGSSRKGSRIVEAVYEVLIERRSGVRQSTSAYLDSAVRDRDFLLMSGGMPSPSVGDEKNRSGAYAGMIAGKPTVGLWLCVILVLSTSSVLASYSLRLRLYPQVCLLRSHQKKLIRGFEAVPVPPDLPLKSGRM